MDLHKIKKKLKKKVAISLIVPVFNDEKNIARYIHSVIDQNNPISCKNKSTLISSLYL